MMKQAMKRKRKIVMITIKLLIDEVFSVRKISNTEYVQFEWFIMKLLTRYLTFKFDLVI